MKVCCWLLFVMLLFMDYRVNAQAACPPGMVPYSTGNDVSACGPDDDQQQQTPVRQQLQPPPPLWIDKWMAIATDAVKGSLGTAVDKSSQNEAEHIALADCQAKGGTQCKVDVSYGNGCAAMVAGDTGYNVHGAPTLEEATQLALKTCNAATTNCHVYYSACSLPQRIR